MPFANATAGGGIHAKKNQNEKTKSTQDQAGSPRPRACQISGARELTFTGIATELSTLHRRLRLLVLLGTSAFVQQTVVTRYRIHLEDRLLAPGTINVRLAAVRRLAYEAADTGLLSPDLAAGIRRVKGAKRLGMRLGNWLTPTQGKELLSVPDRDSMKGKRNYALLAMLLG